jgi:hypothetical protein
MSYPRGTKCWIAHSDACSDATLVSVTRTLEWRGCAEQSRRPPRGRAEYGRKSASKTVISPPHDADRH